MAGVSYVLDCEALSRAALGDAVMKARLKDAHRANPRVVTSSMPLIKAHRSRIRRSEWSAVREGAQRGPSTARAPLRVRLSRRGSRPAG